MMRIAIKVTDDAYVRIARMELQTDRRHLLRRSKQYILAVEFKEVRTLPHPSVLVMGT